MFEIEIGGRGRSVSIDTVGPGRYRVTVDGKSQLVNARSVGPFSLSVIIEGESSTSHDVTIVPAGAPGEMLIGVDGRSVAVIVNGRRTRRSGAAQGAASGAQTISAPMPGRVVRLLVGRGDEVAARQAVVVVEAMKMENELRSPKAGRVKEVMVAAGASVEAGSVLVVIE